MRPEFITVGTVVNAHGVRGEVKVNPHGFDPAFIASFHTLYLNGQAVAVKAVRVHKSTVLLTLPGVEDMDSALALKGCTVAIRRTDAHLPEGQFFDEELEGCAVVVYQVRGGAHEYLIPAVPDVFIVSADPDAEVIRVRMMKGLATDED